MILLQSCVSTGTENSNKISVDKKIDTTALLITASSIINPAIGFGSIIANTTVVQKVYSAVDLTNLAVNGESLAESILSRSTKKSCKLENIIENENICL